MERKFVADNIRKLEVKEFLKRELERAGCGEIDIQRTPLGTRVILSAQKPGLVIGKKGAAIRKLTNILKKKYEIDNPQIEVNELQVPNLNAQVMAENVASMLERGIHFRRAAYTGLRRIMEAGARGAEIEISGKLTGERAKSVKFADGYLKHCGEPAIRYVRHGMAEAAPKPGIMGVKVKIMPPGVKLPDDIELVGEEERAEKKKLKVGEGIEELVAKVEEELEIVDEKEAPKTKKIKPEKVKRKKTTKIEEVVEEPEELEISEEEIEEEV
ncbi:MAG: 30S ribosomal protein S3, partial [Euryarchaeota archaeon]|nr:30S ribosomal protein S3 [Euryarchaeota archaeon]